MAITKTTPAKKTTERRPAEKPENSSTASPAKIVSRVAVSSQIRIEDSTLEPSKVSTSPELRMQMIRDAAYFRAESRGFSEGDPVLDWMEAEAEVDQRLLEERDIAGE